MNHFLGIPHNEYAINNAKQLFWPSRSVPISAMFLHSFYIHQTIHTESGSGFSQKFKSGSEKCSWTLDPLRAHLWCPNGQAERGLSQCGHISKKGRRSFYRDFVQYCSVAKNKGPCSSSKIYVILICFVVYLILCKQYENGMLRSSLVYLTHA